MQYWNGVSVVNTEPRNHTFQYTYLQIFFSYVHHPDGAIITSEFLEAGNYEIEIMGKKYNADLHLKSPFDSEDERVHGIYRHETPLQKASVFN